MPKYVDGFLLPLPKDKVADYQRMSKKASKVWLDHGALEYRECVGDDLDSPFGLPFPKGIRTKPNETVVFAWIVYKSKTHRDAVNKKVMADPRMKEPPAGMPFDMKRMMYGGFKVIVDA